MNNLPAKHVVFGLLADGRHTIESSAVGVGFHDFDHRPPCSAPIQCPTLRNYVIHGPNDFWQQKN